MFNNEAELTEYCELEIIGRSMKPKGHDYEVIENCYVVDWKTGTHYPLKGLKKILKQELSSLYNNLLLCNNTEAQEEDMEILVLNMFLKDHIETQIEEKEKLLKVIEMNLPSKETVMNIERAKQVPVTNFIEFNRAGFAKCIWHGQERTPSMKYYPKTNSCYCFSCNKSGDVIDIVRTLYNLSFKEALLKLS